MQVLSLSFESVVVCIFTPVTNSMHFREIMSTMGVSSPLTSRAHQWVIPSSTDVTDFSGPNYESFTCSKAKAECACDYNFIIFLFPRLLLKVWLQRLTQKWRIICVRNFSSLYLLETCSVNPVYVLVFNSDYPLPHPPSHHSPCSMLTYYLGWGVLAI